MNRTHSLDREPVAAWEPGLRKLLEAGFFTSVKLSIEGDDVVLVRRGGDAA